MSTPNFDPEEYHASTRDEEVAISKLRADPSYQRVPSQEFIDEIARSWDNIKAELPLISNRGPRTNDPNVEGGFFIVSGQHRVRAAHKLGMKTIKSRVMDLTKHPNPVEVEAYYRLGTNRRVGDRAIDTFKAKVAQGDPDALAIVKILEKHGTAVNFDVPNMESGINASSALEVLYSRDGGSVLNEALETLHRVYGPITPKIGSSNMLKAVAWWIDAHGLEADRSRLEEKMGQLTLGQLNARASQMQSIQGKSKYMNIYLVLLELYNEKLSDANKLQANMKGASKIESADKSSHKRRSTSA